MYTQNKIQHALDILSKGQDYLPELEAYLKTLSLQERKKLAAVVVSLNCPAPMVVVYDYENQAWL